MLTNNEFNNLWEDTVYRFNNCEIPITEKTIFYYAKKENAEKYKEIIDKTYIRLIEEEIFKNNDVLTHYTIAKILYILLDKITASFLFGIHVIFYLLNVLCPIFFMFWLIVVFTCVHYNH